MSIASSALALVVDDAEQVWSSSGQAEDYDVLRDAVLRQQASVGMDGLLDWLSRKTHAAHEAGDRQLMLQTMQIWCDELFAELQRTLPSLGVEQRVDLLLDVCSDVELASL